MANIHKGEQHIELGGATYVLRFDFNALAELEDLTGITLGELGKKSFGVKFLRAAVYCGLLHLKLKGMTIHKIGRLIDLRAIEAVSTVVTKALLGALGIDEADDGEQGESNDPLPEGGGERAA